MTKMIIVILYYLLLPASTMAGAYPLSDIVKKCFAHNHQFIQTNYFYAQRDDNTMYNMAEIFRENQEQFLGTFDW